MQVHSDAKLVQSARSGDEKAFERLVEKYRVRIYAAISGFIDNPQDREDIAQETIINAYRNLHQLSKPERFGSWLDTIAQNQCRDWMRRNRVQTVPIDEVEEDLPNSEDSPEHRSVEAEHRRIIAQAIETLPQTERQIARAHYLEDASHDELVSRHGISYQSVSARLFRAKRKLVKRLRHVLGGVLVPPTTALNKISSGGFTAMKIGTVPKITVGVIAIIALAFIGSRQLLSPEADSSPSVEVTASKTDKRDQPGSEIDANRGNVVTALSRADEPQISAEEMGQIEDFFAQLESADAQLNTAEPTEIEFRQDADEHATVNTDVLGEDGEAMGASAEEVMNVYVEALKNLDFEAMLSLETGAAREGTRDLLDGFDNNLSDPVARGMLQSMLSQAEIIGSEYVGDEFHFRLRVPLRMPVLEGLEFPEGLEPPESLQLLEVLPESDILLIKMRKEDGTWRIYKQ